MFDDMFLNCVKVPTNHVKDLRLKKSQIIMRIMLNKTSNKDHKTKEIL